MDASDWPRFVAACALCDPPETALLEFADWGGPFAPDLLLDEADDDSVVASFFLASPSGDWESGEAHGKLVIQNRLLKLLIHELEKRYLKPKKLSAEGILRDIVEGKSEILTEALIDAHTVRSRRSIPVYETTTEDDVRRQYRIIAAEQGTSRKGAPRRDPLVAIQCALLHDLHNYSPGFGDRRRRKWNLERLSEEFGLKGVPAAKIYIAEGRKVLADMRQCGIL